MCVFCDVECQELNGTMMFVDRRTSEHATGGQMDPELDYVMKLTKRSDVNSIKEEDGPYSITA